MNDRSRFLRTIAGGVAATFALPPLTARAASSPDLDTCPAPSARRPVAWRRVPRRTVARISAFDPAYDWKLLRRAYAAMRALPWSDPRSLEAQRNLHAWFCGSCVGGSEIHDRWTFFAWHRGFLAFHERILGALAGDPSLRLPYWDWEVPGRRTIPNGYTRGALADGARFLAPGRSVEREVGPHGKKYSYDLNLVPGLLLLPSEQFLGTATTGAVLENAAHGFVHTSVGGYPGVDTTPDAPGDMAALETAARDPIFYAHHANVDRCWTSWTKVPGHANPVDPEFLRLTFSYFDETGRYVSITAAELCEPGALGYGYDTVIAPPAPAARSVPLQPSGAPGGVRAPSAGDAAAIAAASRVTVGLTELAVSGSGVIELRVATQAGSLDLGQLFITPHTAGGGMTMNDHTVNAQFSVPSSVATALSQPGASITIASAPPAPRPPNVGSSRFPGPPIVGAPAPGGGAPSSGGGAPSPSGTVPPSAKARFRALTIGVAP